MNSGRSADRRVERGDKVEVEYVLEARQAPNPAARGEPPRRTARLETGRFRYRHGADDVEPEIEAALVGLHVGESQVVRLTPEQGLAPYDPKARATVPRDAVPADSRHEGAHLVTRDPLGSELSVVEVREVGEHEIVLDLNPLELTLQMTVAAVG